MVEKNPDSGKSLKPAMPTARIKGTQDAIRKVGETIYVLDLSIEKWIEQLNRAQPHRNGRLAFIFTKDSSVSVDGVRLYEVKPIAGKMIHMKSGDWSFFKLTSKDVHTKLSDLRVGQSLRSDPLVVRLIDGIEDMLKQRDFLIETLGTIRQTLPGKLSAIVASSARRYDEAIDLADRVRLDWTLGADLAEKTIQQKRRDRYVAQKLKKSGECAGV